MGCTPLRSIETGAWNNGIQHGGSGPSRSTFHFNSNVDLLSTILIPYSIGLGSMNFLPFSTLAIAAVLNLLIK